MNWWTAHGPKITNAATVATVALTNLTPLVPPAYTGYVTSLAVLLNGILNITHNMQHNASAPPVEAAQVASK